MMWNSHNIGITRSMVLCALVFFNVRSWEGGVCVIIKKCQCSNKCVTIFFKGEGEKDRNQQKRKFFTPRPPPRGGWKPFETVSSVHSSLSDRRTCKSASSLGPE